MNLKESEQVKFELARVYTLGVRRDTECDGYSITVIVDDEIAEKIDEQVLGRGAESPLHGSIGNIIYLRLDKLSKKQMSELYNKGMVCIEIHFVFKGIYIRNGVNHPRFEVTKLRKTELKKRLTTVRNLYNKGEHDKLQKDRSS